MAKLVKFKNGKYGVKRKWLFIFTQYANLVKPDCWWFKGESFRIKEFAMGTYEEAINALYELEHGIEEEAEIKDGRY